MPQLTDYLRKLFGPSEPLIATNEEMPGVKEYKITNYFFEHETISSENDFSVTGYALNVEERFTEGKAVGSPEFIIYWLLNDNDELKYTRKMETHGDEETVVQFGDFATETFKRKLPRTFGWTLFQLDFQGHKVLFGRVDPKVSKVKASFVRFEKGYFPSEKDVWELRLILSYLFGTFFIDIGSTIFNSASSPIAHRYHSTYKQNLEGIFNQPQLPPIPIRVSQDFHFTVDPEEQINAFISSFIEKEDDLNLAKALWYINYASTQDIFLMMQPLATAFDILCNSFLASIKRTTIIDSDKFSYLIDKIDDLISTSLGKSEQTSKLLGNMKGTNQIGSGQRYTIVLNELKLKLSKSENMALSERNTVIHGSLKEENISKRIFLSRVFYTLLNRMILSILTPGAHYVDYSMRGTRVAPVAEAQEGVLNA